MRCRWNCSNLAFPTVPTKSCSHSTASCGCVDNGGATTGGVERRHHQVLHKKKDSTERGNYRGLFLVAHAGKVLFKIVANRLGDFCEEAGILPEEQCGFWPQYLTTDMMLVVRRLQDLGQTSNTSPEICFIALAKAYDSVDRVLLWEVLGRFGAPPRMIKIIRMFHNGMSSWIMEIS